MKLKDLKRGQFALDVWGGFWHRHKDGALLERDTRIYNDCSVKYQWVELETDEQLLDTEILLIPPHFADTMF